MITTKYVLSYGEPAWYTSEIMCNNFSVPTVEQRVVLAEDGLWAFRDRGRPFDSQLIDYIVDYCTLSYQPN